MRDVSPDVVRRDKTSFGPTLETFVFSELQKIVTWSAQRCTFSHFRDKNKNEVDIVLENRRGEIAGIEVKASATVSSNDFSGMRKLAAASGKKLIQRLVLYDHDHVVPFADNLFAAPLSCLWMHEHLNQTVPEFNSASRCGLGTQEGDSPLIQTVGRYGIKLAGAPGIFSPRDAFTGL